MKGLGNVCEVNRIRESRNEEIQRSKQIGEFVKIAEAQPFNFGMLKNSTRNANGAPDSKNDFDRKNHGQVSQISWLNGNNFEIGIGHGRALEHQVGMQALVPGRCREPP